MPSKTISIATLAGALALGAPLPLSAQAEADARPVSLDEAVRLAQRNSPVAVQARGQIRSAEQARRSAWSAFVPNVNVSTSVTRQIPVRARVDREAGIPLPPIAWSQGQRLSANVDLFNGRRLYDLRATGAQIDAAEVGETASMYQLRLDVSQQYFASLAAREAADAAQAQLAQAEQQFRVAAARVQARTATRSDSLRARIQVGQAQLALLQARTQRLAADAALTRLLAAPVTVTAMPADTALAPIAPAALPDSAALLALAAQGPAVRQAEANVVAARALRRAAKSPYLPTLSMSYGQNITGVSSGFGVVPQELPAVGSQAAVPVTRTGQVSFALSYPIFNQWQREENVARAEIAEVNAEAALRDARFAAQQQLVVALGTLRLATQQAEIQTATVSASEEDLRVQQQRYELGAATLLDVLTSQTQLTNARVALIQARLDARLARATLEALIGRDLGETP